MKVLILVCIVFVAGVSAYTLNDAQKEKLKTFNHECLKESGVDKAKLDEARLKKIYVEGDEKMNSQCTCMMKKSGILKEDGTSNIDYIKSKVDESEHKRIEKCYAISSGIDTPCKIFLCLLDANNTVTYVSA